MHMFWAVGSQKVCTKFLLFAGSFLNSLLSVVLCLRKDPDLCNSFAFVASQVACNLKREP